jgi:hypothetical protein
MANAMLLTAKEAPLYGLIYRDRLRQRGFVAGTGWTRRRIALAPVSNYCGGVIDLDDIIIDLAWCCVRRGQSLKENLLHAELSRAHMPTRLAERTVIWGTGSRISAIAGRPVEVQHTHLSGEPRILAIT